MIIKPVSLAHMQTVQSRCYSEFGWDANTLLSSLCLGDLWVACKGKNLAGFVFSVLHGRQGWIDALFVDPKYRSNGLASKLIAQVETVYKKRGAQKTVLFVRGDNPAQTLYFKLGYRVMSVRQNYYGRGNHAIKMGKKLR